MIGTARHQFLVGLGNRAAALKSQVAPKLMGECGAGTALIVGLLGLSVGLIVALTVPLNLVVEQAKLQAAVDLAAIDASHARRGLVTGYPCEVAARVLHINMETSGKCSIVGEVARVDAFVKVTGIVLSATAWAGP
jgi:hypothetical protein